MDTMEATKIVGAACGALLIYLLVSWTAETIYHVGGAGGHGEKTAAAPADIYNVEDTEVETAGVAGPSIAELLETADVGKGKRTFAKCKACHKLEDGQNGVGPHLYQIVGRTKGAVAGFAYSAVITDLGGVWDINALDEFSANPRGYAKGTKMSFAGLKKASERANLIKYLQSLQGQ